jgi:DNA-directed RNA polymerase specialized sigma subunit
MNDIEMIDHWQKTKDPETFSKLVTRFNPVVHKHVNQYAGTGVSKQALATKARAQLVKSLNTYNPSAGTQPITHVYNNMKKLNRMASESLTSGHIPEDRALKAATYKTTVSNMADRLGREPSAQEVADELKWNVVEVGRMNSELTGETTASKAEFDFYGNSTQGTSVDKELADYMYMELDGNDKVIFEHTFGYAGKPILKNKDIAKILNTNEMSVSRSKKRMGSKLREYR